MARRGTADGRSVKSDRVWGQEGATRAAVDEPGRGKDYLTAAEIVALLDAAKAGRGAEAATTS